MYLVTYFGQAVDGWTCRVCDRCQAGERHAARSLDPEERALVVKALEGIGQLAGRFGKNRIAQFLSGSQSKPVMDAGLHRYSHYGTLSSLDQATVNRLIEALLQAGCIEVTGDPQYPCLRLAEQGRAWLETPSDLALDLPRVLQPEAKPSGKSASAPPAAGGSDLCERLRTIRNELAAKRHVKPFQILANAPLKELAERAPMTVEEARHIKGIGAVTERTVLPHLLEEIERWREEMT